MPGFYAASRYYRVHPRVPRLVGFSIALLVVARFCLDVLAIVLPLYSWPEAGLVVSILVNSGGLALAFHLSVRVAPGRAFFAGGFAYVTGLMFLVGIGALIPSIVDAV